MNETSNEDSLKELKKHLEPTHSEKTIKTDKKRSESHRKSESKKDHKDKIKKQKKKKKKSKKEYKKRSASISSRETKKKIKESKVWDSTNIPEFLKEKYAALESNPLVVIIANIPINVTIEELREYFNTLLVSLKQNSSATGTPIKSIEIGETKNFAIIELSSKDWKKICNSLDNLEYQGFKLMIRKPVGFFDSIYEKKDISDPFGNIITNASEIDNKIYMGGLPTYLKDEDVKKLCESYGMLKYFNLVKDVSSGQSVSKGYCFFEYIDAKVTDKSIKGLNMLEIGDKKLKVQRASAGTNKIIAISQIKQPSNASGSFLGSYPNIRDPNIQIMLNIPLTAITPSRVIQLLNMACLEDLIEDEFFFDLLEDVKDECIKFGPIERIEIPRPDASSGIAGPSVGKVFIKYLYLIPAKRARHYLAGRIYNKRTVIASFYPEEKFDLKEYLIRV